MKHLWMTAAAAALCAIAAQGWAAPQTQYLELVAHKHHLRGAQTAHASGKAHRHGGRAAKTSRRSRHGAHVSERRGHGRHAAQSAAIHAAATQVVKVGKGDTLAAISRKSGVSVEELAKLNGLKKPFHVRLGAKIKLPARRYYVVKSGDTLYSLARRFGVDADDLSSFNAMKEGKSLRSGQKLYLPTAAVDSEAREEPPRAEHPPRRLPPPTIYSPPANSENPPSSEAPAASSAEGQPPASSAESQPPASSGQSFQFVPVRPPAVGPQAQPPVQSGGRPAIIQTNPTPSAADVVAAGHGKFGWPVDGPLISGFGPKPDGQRNDGLNISANAGDAVRASADGVVVYAGDQVPSFGNLVLVKHDGGWVTAYAHMSKILVKNRDQVTQGQQIGVVGQTGAVDRPQLHFEIRYAASPKDKAAPIDPGLLLPVR